MTAPAFVAIVGPTATGKTELAIRLAEQFAGEIICADSQTVLRGMDIGTAKPTRAEQARVPHHLLDIIDPGERLTAATFQSLAMGAMGDIAARGKLPLLVGGSGLYIDAVLFDYQFPGPAADERRQKLDAMGDEELLELLAAEAPDVIPHIDIANRRRVVRAIETAGASRSRQGDVVPQALVLGIMLDKEIVQKRVEQRVEKMLSQGFIDEVKWLGETYGWNSPAFDVIGYQAFRDHVSGSKSLNDAKQDFIRGDMKLYKKQVTWFKRNQSIKWVENYEQAAGLVSGILKL